MTAQPISQTDAAARTAAASEAPAGTKRTIAQYTGHHGTRRVISKADQDAIVGVKGIGKEDLVWPAAHGPRNVDVTDVDEAVLEYLKTDGDFKFREVEVPAES